MFKYNFRNVFGPISIISIVLINTSLSCLLFSLFSFFLFAEKCSSADSAGKRLQVISFAIIVLMLSKHSSEYAEKWWNIYFLLEKSSRNTALETGEIIKFGYNYSPIVNGIIPTSHLADTVYRNFFEFLRGGKSEIRVMESSWVWDIIILDT